MEDDERERSQQKLRKDDRYKLFIIILSFSFHGERSLKNYLDTVKKLAIHKSLKMENMVLNFPTCLDCQYIYIYVEN